MALLDSDKMLNLVQCYHGSPMVQSLLEVFYKQCVMFCTVEPVVQKKNCENCSHRYGNHCRKWTCRTEMGDCCEAWEERDA